LGQEDKYEIKNHAVFDAWYKDLEVSRYTVLYKKVRDRLTNVKKGCFGSHKPVGDGVWELRFKSGQQHDIDLAKRLSKEL